MSAIKPRLPITAGEKIGAGHAEQRHPMPPKAEETAIDNFLQLMRRDLLEPLEKVIDLAGRLESLRASGFLPTTVTGEQLFADLARIAQHSATSAERLLNLGELLAGPPILADEHMLLADRLRSAAHELSETARTKGVGIRLDDIRQNLAPVYGSMRWIDLALRRLVGMLLDAAPTGTHLLMRARQVGFHQLVTVAINHNQPAPATLDLLQGARSSVKTELATARSAEALDLAIARAVIELHGGSMKTDITEGGTLQQFSLTLPTGDSQLLKQRPDCANCPSMRQAEQFAEDIGELLNAMQNQRLEHGSGDRK